MNTLFAINFRREAYQKEIARARRRVLLLGTSLAYFGALAVVLGLYGLNCASLVRRSDQIERQAERMRALQNSNRDWAITAAELTTVERFQSNPRIWRERLIRLAELLPANAVLTSVTINPDNVQTAEGQSKLVITGEMRVPPTQDRMRSVVQLVSALHADPVFSAGYKNIQLASSRAIDGGTRAEFVIECR